MGRQKNDGRGRLGGRAAGTANKKTAEMRELMGDFCKDNYEKFKKAFADAKPDNKCLIYLKALEFTTPKLSSVELTEVGEKKSYLDELREISEEKSSED